MTKRKNKTRGRKFIFTISFLCLLYFGKVYLNQEKMFNELNDERSKLQAKLSYMTHEVEELQEEIANSDSLEFIEKIARDELGMVKPREILIIDRNKTRNPFIIKPSK